jgi:glutamyl/glutaminyl-tRNA synthetase
MFVPYIRDAGMDVSSVSREKLETIISLTRNSCEVLSDIPSLAGIFLKDINPPDQDADKLLKESYSKDIIHAASQVIPSLNNDNLVENFIPGIKDKTEHKGKKLFHPLRAMITGTLRGPALDLAIPLIGYDNLRRRIEYCREKYC